MEDKRLNRRQFLKVSAVGVAGAVLAACGPSPSPSPATEAPSATEAPVVTEAPPAAVPTEAPTAPPPEPTAPPAEPASQFKEPPMLTARVASGELPPVDERLPVNPMVVAGKRQVGTYGGELRALSYDPVWWDNYELNAERPLHFSEEGLKTIIGNVIESWEVAEDGKVYTLHLRKGMKWSTGNPLTTEDIRFWWEDIANNADIGGWVDGYFQTAGENAQLEFPDEYTVKVTFVQPYGTFPLQLTRPSIGEMMFISPSAYLKQFHPKYTDQAKLDEMATAEGMDGWVSLFWDRDQWGAGVWQGPKNVKEWPTVAPWIVVETPQEGLYLWERNPYYWKVDVEGNQLPYIDTKRYEYVQTGEALKLKVAQGEVDFVGTEQVSIADYPLYKENEAKSNYVVGQQISCMTDRYVLFPQRNLAEDPVLEKIVQEPNFVRALSVAIDREEINQSLFFGQAKVGQIAPFPQSSYYKEEYGQAFAQYDPDLANQLLDEIGLDKRDSQNFRLRSDGKRLSYNIEHTGVRVGSATAPFTEMIVSYWQAIGIDATTKEISTDLSDERNTQGLIHCGVWHNDRCTNMLMPIDISMYIPVGNPRQYSTGSKWSQWYEADDKTAEGLVEPPDWLKEMYDNYDKMQLVMDEDERVALGQKIFDKLAEAPLALGVVLESPCPLIFNKNMRNIPPAGVPVGYDTWGISTYHPEAMYYEGGERA